MFGIVKGLYTTGKHVFRKRFTFQYPKEKRVLPERYRGLLQLHGMIGETSSDVEPCEYLPPCSTNCPSHVDARSQNILVAEDKYIDAFKIVRERNILPGVLGRICHHPCESVCKRGYYDGSVAIRNLHTYISDKFLEAKPKIANSNKGKKGKSVGIIGAGPSGLAAAYDLINLGYYVTIYEKLDVAGGALAFGVPKYRLPKDILGSEIDSLKDLGVEIKTGMEAGKDFQLDDLFNKFSHNSILLAVGLQISRGLPVPGMDLEGVSLALPFLKAVNFGERIKPVKKLLVIGGGNVAIDVARCAIRVGYKEVHMACLESADEMPAHDWEIEEANEEGIIIHNCMGPREILGDDKGKVKAVKFIRCLSVFDEEKRFSPKFDKADENTIECDNLIIAIGQMSDLEFAKNARVRLNERGQLEIDRSTLQTSREGVFACGEVITGPGSAIGSIASGHEAAISIDNYLSGRDLNYGRERYKTLEWHEAIPVMQTDGYSESFGDEGFPAYHYPKGMVHERIGNFVPTVQFLRQKPKFVDPEARKKNFDEFEPAFSDKQAWIEGWRCLRCESRKCVGCGICANVCPTNALKLEVTQHKHKRVLSRYDLDVSLCTFCGICSENCPTLALYHSQEYELAQNSKEKMILNKYKLISAQKSEVKDEIDKPNGKGVPERIKIVLPTKTENDKKSIDSSKMHSNIKSKDGV